MDKELNTEFDVIVLGTGFTESLIASAAARIGKKVMHIDRNDYYGGQWASFSLASIEKWANEFSASPEQLPILKSEIVENGESFKRISEVNHTYFGVKLQWHVQDLVTEDNSCATEKNEAISNDVEQEASNEKLEGSNSVQDDSNTKVWSKEDLLKLTRKFNIDLTPKLLFSRGPLVELLISSNVARYLEFKCISRILTWLKSDQNQDTGPVGKLVTVPCSRSDVFTTDVIGLVEKRILMKFLQLCNSYEQQEEQWKSYSDKPFKEFLISQKLTPTLIQFVTNAIGMVDETVDTVVGLKKTHRFLNSLGRYGTMPFLFSMYGSGEMPQAFCRLCAVFEGVYILRRSVEGIILNEKNYVVEVLSEGQKFKCKNLVMDVNYTLQGCKTGSKQNCISRGIFITDRTLLEGEKEHLTLFRMPVDDENYIPVTVLEVGPCTGTTAPGTYLVYFFCNGQDAEADFKITQQRLFSDVDGLKPKVLFSLYFNQNGHDASIVNQTPSNVYICSGPDAELDYDESISRAKSIFMEMFPDEEFLPRAPDHDEIIFEGDPPSGTGTFEESSTVIENLDSEKEVITVEPKENEPKYDTEDCNTGS